MKFLFDFFPVLIFYIVFKYFKAEHGEIQAMIYATASLMVATLVQVAINWFMHKKVEKMHIAVLVLAMVFGGATIYFQEPVYLIWKVTLANWLFAAVFLGSHFIGKTPLVKRMMQHAISLPEPVWTRLSYMWISFFIVLGGINLAVAFNVSFDAWTDFKMFGMIGITLLFVFAQAIYMARFMEPEKAKAEKISNEQ